MDLSIIIPCYNEADNVDKIQAELFPIVNTLAETQTVEVIFIDDGSCDDTCQIFATAFVQADLAPQVTLRFERHEKNQGLGAALRTGFAAAKGNIILTTDSDGTYKFSEIPQLLSYLTPGIDIVTASPYHPLGGIKDVPAYRLVLSQGASALYRLLADWRIHTYTALFRAYRRNVTEDVPFESNGFLGGTELLINAMRMGYKVAEYPAVLHSRVHGASKAKLARTVKAHLLFQFQIIVPWHPYGMTLQGSDESIYLYTNFEKRLFPSAEVFLSHGYHWPQVIRVSDKYLARLNTGLPMTFREGSLVKGTSDNTVFFIEHGQKRPFHKAAAFESLGYQWRHILTVSDETLAKIETGPEINTLDHHPDGTLIKLATDETIYLLENGKKRPFYTAQVFLSWGYKWDQVVTVTPAELDSYPTGLPMSPQKSFFQEHHHLADMEAERVSKTKLFNNFGSTIYWVFNRHATQLKYKF